MKHRLCLTILLGLATLIARAQQDLNVSPVFQGKIVPRGEMVDVRAKGRAISKYRLDYYHSIRFKVSEQQRAMVNELVEKDRKNAVGVEQKRRKTTRVLSLLCLSKVLNINISVILHSRKGTLLLSH